MTQRNSERIAGFALIAYIAIGIAQMVIGAGTTTGDTISARLANLAAHLTQVRINALLGLATCFLAIALGVSLYAITRDADEELAAFGRACRIAEGIVGALPLFATRALLWLSSPDSAGSMAAGGSSLAAMLFASKGWFPIIGAVFFAAGSAAFSLALLRGRLVPVVLAWIGVVASVLLLPLLALQFVGVLSGAVTGWMWAPMAIFELWLGAWLTARGTYPSRAIIGPAGGTPAAPR